MRLSVEVKRVANNSLPGVVHVECDEGAMTCADEVLTEAIEQARKAS
jgi:hypothetical protein